MEGEIQSTYIQQKSVGKLYTRLTELYCVRNNLTDIETNPSSQGYGASSETKGINRTLHWKVLFWDEAESVSVKLDQWKSSLKKMYSMMSLHPCQYNWTTNFSVLLPLTWDRLYPFYIRAEIPGSWHWVWWCRWSRSLPLPPDTAGRGRRHGTAWSQWV